MRKESEAILLRIFIGESDKYSGKPLYRYLLEMFKSEGLAGTTILRSVGGFGKSSYIHSGKTLQLSTDLPIVIEVVDKRDKIEMIKTKLDNVIPGGLIIEEKMNIIFYEGIDKEKK